MDLSKIYIDGNWIEPSTNKFIDVINPATKKKIAEIPRSNKKDVDRAVQAAKLAFDTWGLTSLEERINLMEKLKAQLNSNLDLMTDIIVKELGSGYNFTKNTHIIPYIEEIDYFINLVKIYKFEEEFEGFRVLKEPVGVVAAITPWNYPLGQITKKIIPALLAGNTVVLKPSQQTPIIAYYLTECIEKSGFPKGVFNLVPGIGSEVGDMLSRHEDVDLVSFTGSTTAGIQVGQNALETVKKITLELGGKSPSLILEDADLELAVESTLDMVYYNTGQTCSAWTRLLVPENKKAEIEDIIIEKTKKYKFGNPVDKEVMIGPLVSKKQFDKVKKYIEKGIEEGAKVLLGNIPSNDDKGFYINPVVFTDVDNNMTIAREEIFGPVLSIIAYKNIEDAIKIANDTKYGLSGAIFGNKEKAIKIARKIKTGNIKINGKDSANAPFGGYKQSGLGREGSVYGFEEYLEIKAVFV